MFFRISLPMYVQKEEYRLHFVTDFIKRLDVKDKMYIQ